MQAADSLRATCPDCYNEWLTLWRNSKRQLPHTKGRLLSSSSASHLPPCFQHPKQPTLLAIVFDSKQCYFPPRPNSQYVLSSPGCTVHLLLSSEAPAPTLLIQLKVAFPPFQRLRFQPLSPGLECGGQRWEAVGAGGPGEQGHLGKEQGAQSEVGRNDDYTFSFQHSSRRPFPTS